MIQSDEWVEVTRNTFRIIKGNSLSAKSPLNIPVTGNWGTAMWLSMTSSIYNYSFGIKISTVYDIPSVMNLMSETHIIRYFRGVSVAQFVT